MAAAFVGTPTTTTSNSTSSLTIAKPSGLSDGELLVGATMFRQTPADNTSTASGPSGWVLNTPHLENNGQNEQWYKTVAAASAESGATDYTWTSGQAANRACGLIARVSGVDLTTPIDAAAATATSGLTAAAITTVADNALVVLYVTAHVAATATLTTSVPGMTKIAEVQCGTTSTSVLAIHAMNQSPAGATGNKTVTVTGGTASSSTVWMLSLNPLVAAPSVWSYSYDVRIG